MLGHYYSLSNFTLATIRLSPFSQRTQCMLVVVVISKCCARQIHLCSLLESQAGMEKQSTFDNLLAPLSNQPDPSFLQNSCTGKEIESDGSKPREEDSGQGNVAAPCDGPTTGPIKTTSSCGGFTCCVLRCYHNSRRDKHLKCLLCRGLVGAKLKQIIAIF